MPARSARRRAGLVVGLSLTTASIVGLQAVHSVAQAKGNTPNPVTGCSEDSFFSGAASPDPGIPVTIPLGGSQTFSVVYHDETAINSNPGFAPLYTLSDSAGHVVQSGAPATSPTSAPAGTNDKFNTLVSVVLGPQGPGNYTLTIKAWDGDQNKAGGDCGVAAWNVNTPAPPTTTPPTGPSTAPRRSARRRQAPPVPPPVPQRAQR